MTAKPLFARAARRLVSAARSLAPEPDGFPVGKVLISVSAVAAPLGAFAADWNRTHIYNPNWPPHAKFHNAQTMVSGVQTAALSLLQLWGPSPDERYSLRFGTLLAALYWMSQDAASFFPGTALVDPEFEDELPTVAGIKLNQLIPQVLVMYPLIVAGYALESRRLRRAGR